jgi:hypothetical protein
MTREEYTKSLQSCRRWVCRVEFPHRYCAGPSVGLRHGWDGHRASRLRWGCNDFNLSAKAPMPEERLVLAELEWNQSTGVRRYVNIDRLDS